VRIKNKNASQDIDECKKGDGVTF